MGDGYPDACWSPAEREIITHPVVVAHRTRPLSPPPFSALGARVGLVGEVLAGVLASAFFLGFCPGPVRHP